jgi:hypothetical protein
VKSQGHADAIFEGGRLGHQPHQCGGVSAKDVDKKGWEGPPEGLGTCPQRLWMASSALRGSA